MEPKAKNWEEDRHWLDNVVALDCNNFADEGITEEMFAAAKFIQLGEITKDLCKKVTKLEAHVKTNTSP